MENEALKYILSNISFGVLFVWLLMDTRKESKQREEKYQDVIDKLADKFNVVEDIKNDVEEIKNKFK